MNGIPLREQLALLETLRAHPGWALVRGELEALYDAAIGDLLAPGLDPLALKDAAGRANAYRTALGLPDQMYGKLQEEVDR